MDTIAALPSNSTIEFHTKPPPANDDDVVMDGNRGDHGVCDRKRKRTYSEFESGGNGRYQSTRGRERKRRRLNHSVKVLSWQRVIAENGQSNGFDETLDYDRRRRERKDENEIINKLEEVMGNASSVP